MTFTKPYRLLTFLASVFLCSEFTSATADPTCEQVGKEAYVYGLPLVQMYTARQEFLEKTPLNEFRHAREPLGPDFDKVVAPNADVLPSIAWLDLRTEPMILEIPDTKDRYVSFQAIDFYTENEAYASTRTLAGKFKRFGYVGPDWQGRLPEGVQSINCSTPAVALIARTYFANTNDLPAVRALQDQYKLTPLSKWQGRSSANTPPANYPKFDRTDPLSFFVVMDEAIHENPPPFRLSAPLARFQTIGIGGAKPFSVAALDASTRTCLTQALTAGAQTVEDRRKQLAKTTNGWRLPPRTVGRYGDDYLTRATLASVRLGFDSPRECAVLIAREEPDHTPFDSAHRYVLRFEKNHLPPAEAFWSLTMYQAPQGTLTANALNRYGLRSLDPALRHGADGSVEIYIQHDSPGGDKEANWLPAPTGNFMMVLRVYDPTLAMMKGQWTPPEIKRLP